MFKFFHGAPYAVCVELKNFYLFVFCFGGLLRTDPGYVVKQCPRIVMNKIFYWH